MRSPASGYAFLPPLIATLWLGLSTSLADWPQLRGAPGHSGYLAAQVDSPLRVAWAIEFEGERLGTAMEPIVSNDRLFVGTHAGSLYALSAQAGEPLWRFTAPGAFLHSPSVHERTVIAASTDGWIYGVAAADGQLRWTVAAGQGGCAAAPVIDAGVAFIGTRAGRLLAIDAPTDQVKWNATLPAPIRQTAAVHRGKVFVTSEDLQLHCLDAATGDPVWRSRKLSGQTARDYYPVIVTTTGGTFVVVRTNPLLGMGQRIGRDRTMLCRNAGVDDSSWKTIDAWVKSEEARGTPGLWAKEQAAVVAYLEEQPDAQSFFVFDAGNGDEPHVAPVLWVAGCQAVGAQPASTEDGRLLVFYRSAYGNWNHGVAPLVALGLLDLTRNHITPLFHEQGRQPPWNLFWGTADESQNFLVAGRRVLIVHQGTLSLFDLDRNRLLPGYGNRDTFGGWPSPGWARNEWHGPGRGGVALAAGHVYWQTGSRILCLSSGPRTEPTLRRIEDGLVRTVRAPRAELPSMQWYREELDRVAREVLSAAWAPLFVEPGLAGRQFCFDQSGELFEALARAWKHLPSATRALAEERLAREWAEHPPFTDRSRLPLSRGEAREPFAVPLEYRTQSGRATFADPFGGVYAAWLYASECDRRERVLSRWPEIRRAFEDFLGSGWTLDSEKGDLHANRYLRALFATEKLARLAGDKATEERASAKRSETTKALLAWWTRAAGTGTLTEFQGVGQLDPFIGRGDEISFRVAPHRHNVALFRDLSPEIGFLVREGAPEAADRVWTIFQRLYQTWFLAGEERQVHFGENFVDPPDLALGGFQALAWVKGADSETLRRHVDIPFCRADLYYLMKLAVALEQ